MKKFLYETFCALCILGLLSLIPIYIYSRIKFAAETCHKVHPDTNIVLCILWETKK